MTKFRPCIDLHSGQVKQIVGATLNDTGTGLQTNHVSDNPADYFAQIYKNRALTGGHIIMLGNGNESAAEKALKSWPKALQIGGGIDKGNAMRWIQQGAEKVIVTSYLFPRGKFSQQCLDGLLEVLGGDRERLVIDLSCRKREDTWFVAMNKWQTMTDFEITQEKLESLESYCSEFLVHAADNEGLQKGIDEDLIQKLGQWCSIPVTYAGGAKDLDDLDRVKELSNGKLDLTIGSALDIFGGTSIRFEDCVSWNNSQAQA